MKRVLKWVAIVLCGCVALLFAVLAFAYGTYYSVISAKPGGLTTSATPGALGIFVDPFIGTGGVPWVCAYDTPAATVPFGLVRLAPDTASLFNNTTGLNAAGYYYGDNKIIGFSHTRLVGADALEGGLFRLFPAPASRIDKARAAQRSTRFSHREETAFPGYYAVRLADEGVLAELTATPRVGVHRYTFQKGEIPHVLVDVTSALGDRTAKEGSVTILSSANEIEGHCRAFGSFSSRYDGLDAYFVARFSQPFTSFGTLEDGAYRAGAASAQGENIGTDVEFASRGEATVIEVRLALSHVSLANARKNLDAEAQGLSFDDLAGAAREAWEERLATIRIEGGDIHQRRVFYTALYHAFLMPSVFNDVNGEYMGFDRQVHTAEGFRYFTDMSLWDTVRTVHPLYNLIARADQRDMMCSLVEIAKAGGCLPRWPAGCGYTNCMFGTPADIAVSEAYLKGIRDFDIEKAYAVARQVALIGKPAESRFAGRDGLDAYLQYGYCPEEKMKKAVSATLEFCYEDYALSLLATALGRDADATEFSKHAQFYRNLWNPATQYFQPKSSAGVFFKDFRPLKSSYIDSSGKYTNDYVEGSALQWRWSVPFDPEGLVGLFKDREYFVSELESFFAHANKNKGRWYPGSYYWHGNEPDIHAAYLFNAAGRPDLTQKWVRWILDTRYGDDYVGLDGNDDGGTLSAWYVFSALGFYPIAGTTKYELGTPLFDKAEIHIGDRILTIIADRPSPDCFYVTRVTLNDVPLDRTSFTHDQIAQGGTLRFEMAASPPSAP